MILNIQLYNARKHIHKSKSSLKKKKCLVELLEILFSAYHKSRNSIQFVLNLQSYNKRVKNVANIAVQCS